MVFLFEVLKIWTLTNMDEVDEWRTRFISDFLGILDGISQIPNANFLFPALGCFSFVTKVGLTLIWPQGQLWQSR